MFLAILLPQFVAHFTQEPRIMTIFLWKCALCRERKRERERRAEGDGALVMTAYKFQMQMLNKAVPSSPGQPAQPFVSVICCTRCGVCTWQSLWLSSAVAQLLWVRLPSLLSHFSSSSCTAPTCGCATIASALR